MIINIKLDLALNNLQRLTCHKIQPTNQPTWGTFIIFSRANFKFVLLDQVHPGR